MEHKNRRDYSLLQKIGLSKTAVRCYQSLANDGPAKVSVLAKRLGLPRTGLYRVLESLNDQGFVHKWDLAGSSISYNAVPINDAVESYFKRVKQMIAPLLGGYEKPLRKVSKF